MLVRSSMSLAWIPQGGGSPFLSRQVGAAGCRQLSYSNSILRKPNSTYEVSTTHLPQNIRLEITHVGSIASADTVSLASMATYGSVYPDEEEETPIEYQLDRLELTPQYEQYSIGPSTSTSDTNPMNAHPNSESPVSPITSESSQYSASPICVDPQVGSPTNAFESFSHYYNPASVPSHQQPHQRQRQRQHHPQQQQQRTSFAPGSPARYWHLTSPSSSTPHPPPPPTPSPPDPP